MFDSTNYPHDVQYTVKPENKPVVKLSAHYPSISEINETTRNQAEKDYQTYLNNKFQAELAEISPNWLNVLAS